MTFRTRVFIGSLAAATIPLAALGFLVSKEGSRRLEQQYRIRVEDRVQDVERRLDGASRNLAGRLRAVRDRALEDDALRLDLVSGQQGSSYVREWAEAAMPLSGLQMLQLQDASGVILSSGHFRSDFGRRDPDLPRLLERGGEGAALVHAATASGSELMLAGVQTLRIGAVPLWVVGGVNARSVIPDLDRAPLTVELRLGDGPPGEASAVGTRQDDRAAPEEVRALLPVPLYVPRLGAAPAGSEGPVAARLDTAHVVVRHDLSAVSSLRRQTALSLAVGVLLASLFAAALSRWMADRVTAPLEELARRTARLDLENLDVVFDTGRRDEVGRLSRFLDGMTERIRESAARVRSAERRAALGDVARQVNHDVKNAVAPIRNVVRHLNEVERSTPERLAGVFRERLDTLQAGVDYLAELAGRYGRLGAPGTREPFDVTSTLASLRDGWGIGERVDVELPDHPLYVHGDRLALRRILENLVANAVDSLRSPGARVTVSVRPDFVEGPAGATPSVDIRVADQGCGMDRDTLDKAQHDFFTTKDGGTGLGLSIVRRLVADFNGTLTITSRPGQGTTVRIHIPQTSPEPS